MRNITLICTVHRENGVGNASELLRILRTIEPQVIFTEIRLSDQWSVEFQAIDKYREFNRQCQPVPVDKFDMPVHRLVEIKNDYDRARDYAAQASHEYQLLDEENNNRVNQHGFKHLNDLACATILARMSEIEEKAIAESGDQNLIRGLESWQGANQRREVEMVGNIYKYCRENVFDIGVLLVGAAHKTGVSNEVNKYFGAEARLISWNFTYDGQTRAT